MAKATNNADDTPTMFTVPELQSAWHALRENRNEYHVNRSFFADCIVAFGRKLYEARKTFSNPAKGTDDDTAFGEWLDENGFTEEELSKDDRAAYIKLGDPERETTVREVIRGCEARNPRVLWGKVARKLKSGADGDDAGAGDDEQAADEPADAEEAYEPTSPPMPKDDLRSAIAKIEAHAKFMRSLDTDAFLLAYDQALGELHAEKPNKDPDAEPNEPWDLRCDLTEIEFRTRDLGHSI